ncbi:MAG: FG-GAP repeat protein [Planctomycetota bacterium]
MIKTTQLILLSMAIFSASSSALEPTYLEIKHPDGTPPRGAQFGNSIAILDFDADGHQDVAAAASGQSRVHVFFGPTFRLHRSFAPPGDPQQDHFGYDVAAGPVDSAPGDELIVSAPDRKVGGADRAGMLYVFGAGLKHPVLLTAPGSGADERLGNSVTVGDFDADGLMDIAGGASGYRDTR